MKKLMMHASLLLATLFLSTVTVMAQPNGRHHAPQGGPFEAIEELESELKLTPEQREAIEALQQKTQEAHKEWRKEGREARKEHGAQRKAIHESLKSELNGILTPEQAQMLKAHHDAKKAEHKEARNEMRTYQEQNIEPVLLSQRKKLEAKISAADKATLAKIRAARQGMRQEKGRTSGGKREKAETNPNKEALSALVQKYSDDINALMQEIEPQREQWKKDMKAIAVAHRLEGKGRKGQEKMGHRAPKPAFHKSRFLLMDPALTPEIDKNIRD
ncbi:MAG: hypothetical protein RIC19_01400 [Phaeodactylibacter sp.]|uniref:Spy/CpxP family protein refolding chaperone n=1 Tax=Phaeodactylibacter sp. TaxID=1940289 RepID=UPI0032EB4084